MIQLFLSPAGRIGRGQYWMSTILQSVFLIIGFTIIVLSLSNGLGVKHITPETVQGLAGKAIVAIVAGIILLFMGIWSTFCLVVKRLHDRDKTGWFYLLMFVPAASFWLLFIECGCLPGTPGNNTYGSPGGAGKKYADVFGDEPDNSVDIDAMIARAKAKKLVDSRNGGGVAGVGQLAMARPVGPPVFGKRR